MNTKIINKIKIKKFNVYLINLKVYFNINRFLKDYFLMNVQLNYIKNYNN